VEEGKIMREEEFKSQDEGGRVQIMNNDFDNEIHCAFCKETFLDDRYDNYSYCQSELCTGVVDPENNFWEPRGCGITDFWEPRG
jgi:hypothetical protein